MVIDPKNVNDSEYFMAEIVEERDCRRCIHHQMGWPDDPSWDWGKTHICVIPLGEPGAYNASLLADARDKDADAQLKRNAENCGNFERRKP